MRSCGRPWGIQRRGLSQGTGTARRCPDPRNAGCGAWGRGLCWVEMGFLVLLATVFFLWTSSAATIFYMGNAVLRLVLGVAVFAVVMRVLQPARPWRLVAAAATLLGLFLAIWGNTYDHRWALWGHIAAALVFTGWLLQRMERWRIGIAVAVIAALPGLLSYQKARIRNPELAPLSMEGE